MSSQCQLIACLCVLLCAASVAAEQPANDNVASVGEVSDYAPISFELDVQPIMTARGCNQGACHGKQRGQNGFQLSLLGFDSDYDFHALGTNARSRRLSFASPESSLLLRKATAQVPHGGGRKIEIDSPDYETLVNWISQGAPRRLPNEPTLQRVELSKEIYSLKPDQSVAQKVTAYYSDSTSRDVTLSTSYLSNDAAIVSVDDRGRLTAGPLPGETAVMARYMNHICVARVSIPQTEMLPEGFFSKLPQANFIDKLIYAKLEKLGVKPSQPAADATFMRRVYTDIIGRLPTVAEAEAFLDSSLENKRELLVDQLLDRPEYTDHWANHWADLLRPNPYRVGIKAVLNYDAWIRKQFRDDVSYDEFARQIITARGSTWQNGPATLYRDRRTPDEVATMISQLFLGVRLECAKCHHHPFEKYSQADFYSFAAFFGRVGRKGKGLSPPISGGEEIVFTSTKGDVKHPVTGEVLPPRPLFGKADLDDHSDPREALADWMTSPENEFFAQVQVNRVWAQLMGRGLVDPVDDLRSTNPATNPELLDALAKHFQDSGYRQKELIKTITLSNVYSLSSTPDETNSGDRLNYSRHYRGRLRAEVLMDAIADITGSNKNLDAMPPGSRANQVWTHRIDSVFLDTFGRPNENQDPPCERLPDSSVTQTLHLMNSQELNDRIRKDGSRADTLAKSKLTAEEVADELYLSIFSRWPNQREQDYAAKLIRLAGDERRSAIEDLMWAMLNAPEFTIQN
ncbi:DUF1549 and DUF1553 domain-containing protein [Stieleria marina]|uniref:DUF1549 and DUF1553 domain-containing protein n=1 Tax=Stieleria marina TaxID=1930275 RepID=UPI003AF3C06F